MVEKIMLIHDNNEMIRERVKGSKKISEVITKFKTLIKNDINPDKNQVTVWVGDTHLYVAYRRAHNGYDITVIKNHETFSFIYDDAGLFSEDMDGNLHQIKTIDGITKLMGIK